MRTSAKEARIAVRVTADEEAVIKAAATAEGSTVTDFTVSSAVARAHDVLADRRLFIVDDAAWNEFNAILDRPVQHKPELEKLLSEPSIFHTPDTP